MKKRMLAAASIIMAGMIAGCGSGGSSMMSAPAATSTGVTAVSGKVADGYLVNATVFMDKNRNYRLDAGEPSATTDANGAYTLTVDPADVGKYPIVAMAVQGVTVDLDTNEKVATSYVMSMPKDSVSGTVSSNFISPFSSLLRELVESGKYASVQDAMVDLRKTLHMPAGTNMMGDYLASHNTQMHTTAQNMAALMGGQMPQVFGIHSSASRIDVNRYRGMMGAIFINMSSLKGEKPPMTELMNNMMSNLINIKPGQPFRNMSSSFRGMMGGGTGAGSMMGSGAGSMMGSGSGSMMNR